MTADTHNTAEAALNRLPEAHAALVCALQVIGDRVVRLGEADRDDLFELVKCWLDGESDEERAAARAGIIEILDNHSLEAVRLALPVGEQVIARPELKQWAECVGKRVRAVREKTGFTQEQLASRSGLPQSHISRVENGHHCPSHATLEKLASALSVPLSEFDPSVSGA